ncbi:hypothetical protein LLH00_03910 [bacterium]|nr:hypothetical protein [bacterium]
MPRGRKGLLRGMLALVLLGVVLGGISLTLRGIPLLDERYKKVDLPLSDSLDLTDGIHLVGLETARAFVESHAGAVLDARDPEQYVQGHLPGARLCHVYELDSYLPGLLDSLTLDTPLLVYCTGQDCEDSRFLAQSLQEVGYRRIFIYTGGFGQWAQQGLTVETGNSGTAAAAVDKAGRALDFSRLAPAWLWLVLDLLALALGLFVAWRALAGGLSPRLAAFALRAVGLVFVAASLHKVVAPLEFARAVDNYQILPWYAINAVAMVMPWLELCGGLLLLAGRLRLPASGILLVLTGVFILAVGFNIARGLQFDCGCFGGAHTPAWQVLVRDLGLFGCLLPGLKPKA